MTNVSIEDLLRENIKQLTDDLCKSFERQKELSDRVRQLESIEFRARILANAIMRKRNGHDLRARDVDADIEQAYLLLLSALKEIENEYIDAARQDV